MATKAATRSVRLIPVPSPILESPFFSAQQDLTLLHEEHGGLPLPLKHAATLEVLAFMAAVREHEPHNALVVEEWGSAVLGIPASPVTSPTMTRRSLPTSPRMQAAALASASPSPCGSASGSRSPFIPVPCAPETEPESENHALFAPVHVAAANASPRFVPVPINPEVDAGRQTRSSSMRTGSLPGSPASSPPLSSSPSFSSLGAANVASSPAATASAKKATGYFPIQGGTKRASPLSSPPVLPDDELAVDVSALGIATGDSRVEALVAAHLNAARDAAGLALLPVLVNGPAPSSTPLSSAKSIAALSPADLAAWTKYYLGTEVGGTAGIKALRAAVGLSN